MQSRLDYQTASPDTMKALLALEQKVRASGLEHSLVELVKTRASQINGCAFCIHMHTRDARAVGESEDRLHLLAAWRESPLYTSRERAALAWTESLTRIADTGAPDADFAQAHDAFTDDELARLTLLIGTINIWNRFAIGFRAIHPVD
ncbi:carboxymuconolactone decarboxylase family protein [Algiphilus sp.]|uniref:carboxymuconolactone decarboxylase family protein n=1 Tax=Algiphilus sp. TaxID=1872431 RepID=UPI003C4DA60F